MLERMKTPSDDIIAFEGVDKLTQDDYLMILRPVLEEVAKAGQRIRFLFYLGPRFKGFTASAAWQDIKVGLDYTKVFEKCAIVSDLDWVTGISAIFGSLMPIEVQCFKNSELHDSMAWLNSGDIGLDYQLDAQKGTLKIEISSPLTTATFDKLSHIVDPYIEKNGKLNGLVLHVNKFPGWENLGSFVSHMRFVKDHHKKIRRVAFSAGGPVAQMVPPLAKHFVSAEIKGFDFDKLEEASTWAAG